MTHLPYVAACYILGALVPVTLAADAWLRMRRAQRALAAAETGPTRTAAP